MHRRTRRLLLGVARCGAMLTMVSCGSEQSQEGEAQGLIREGMTKSQVEEVLGRPQEIDTTGVIYDVEAGTKRRVERWHYEKRTAVFLNDTLRSANSK